MGIKMETAAEGNATNKGLAQTAAEGPGLELTQEWGYGNELAQTAAADPTTLTCYAYGTTVVRRSAEGTSETVPIEDVEEGDYILAKGTQGLFFTEAIVVDLHPASNSESLTLKTNSG